jgi:hypothetical protein
MSTDEPPSISPIVTRGVIGWGNRKGGVEAYGPLGRWATATDMPNRSNANVVYGDLLGDHLDELGAHEGSYLIVVAVPSRFGAEQADRIEARIRMVIADVE